MNKILIITLISVCFALASNCTPGSTDPDCLCHPSCICEEKSSICKSCRLESIGSVLDQFKKSCSCPAGYYTSSLKPFNCSKVIVPDQEENNLEYTACKREIEMRIKDISLITNCYFCNIEGKSYIVSDVSLQLNKVNLSENCKNEISQKIQYLRPETNSYTDLNQNYLSQRKNGGWEIKIPLIEVYNLSMTNNVSSSQISQQINLLSLLGTAEKYVKKIRWAICIYTNRDVVQVFQLDIDIQQTEQDCVDCIVIADLETVGEVYSDNTFTSKLTAPFQYFVGDFFYAKITFKDTSYTKFLKFVSLYYKNDLGQIYDYSSITIHSWQNNGLTIALPLSEPSHPAVIQVQMLIDDQQGGRFLQEQATQESEKQKTNFSVEIKSDDQNPENSQSSNTSIILLGLINFIAVLLLV